MKVVVRYFGMIAERLEKDAEESLIQFEGEGIDLKDYFDKKYPELAKMTYQIAVDQVLRENLQSGEEVKEIALLPPFAGG